MDRDVQSTLRSLSKAQRETLVEGGKCVSSYKPAQKLVELGIWDGKGDEYTIYPSLTEFGKVVREAALTEIKESKQ